MERKLEYQGNIFELKIGGEDNSLENFHISDISKLLNSFERALTKTVSKDDLEKIKKSDKIPIRLVDISDGSTIIKFKSDFPAISTAFNLLTLSISKDDYSKIPDKAYPHIREMSQFSCKYRCSVELNSYGTDTVKAKIYPDKILDPASSRRDDFDNFIEDHTTIYAKVDKVGGHPPFVSLSLSRNKIINCGIDEELALKLAKKLYKYVGLEGIAKTNVDDFTIDSFEILRITNYEDIPLTEAMKELRKVAGKHWDKIEDPDKYIAELRRNV